MEREKAKWQWCDYIIISKNKKILKANLGVRYAIKCKVEVINIRDRK